MVGILLSFWDSLFSGAMLVSGRVHIISYILMWLLSSSMIIGILTQFSLGFVHVFHGHFGFFHYNLVGGTRGKLLENHDKPMFFHELFVGGTLAKQTVGKPRKNNGF